MLDLRKWVLRLGFWIPAALLFALALTYLFLTTSLGRGIIEGELERRLSSLFVGTVEIGEVSQVSLWGVGLQSITLSDADGQVVASVSSAVIRFDLAEIAQGHILLPRLEVRDPSLQLEAGDQTYSFLEALALAADEGPGGAPLRVTLPEIIVTGGRIHGSALPVEGVEVANLAGTIGVSVEPGVHVSASRLRADIVDRDGHTLAVGPLRAEIELGQESTAFVHGEIRAPESAGRMGVDVRLTDLAQPLTMAIVAEATLKDMGPSLLAPFFDVSATEFAAVDGRITANGRLRGNGWLEAELTSEAGNLVLRAERSDAEMLQVTASTQSLEPHRLVAGLPLGILVGDVGLRVGLDDADGFDVEFSTGQLTWNDEDLPPVAAYGAYSKVGLEVRTLRFDHLGERLILKGRFGGTQQVSLGCTLDELDVGHDPWIQAFLPGLTGRISGGLSAAWSPDSEVPLTMEGELAIHDAAYQSNAIDSLEISGTANGELRWPSLDLSVTGEQINWGDTHVDGVGLTVSGSGAAYRVAGRVSLANDVRADLDLFAEGSPSHLLVDGGLVLQAGRESVTAEITGLRVEPDSGFYVDELALQYRASSLTVAGEYHFDTGADFSARVRQLDLRRLSRRLGIPSFPIAGLVDGTVDLSGTPAEPAFGVELWLSQGNLPPMGDLEAHIQLSYADGTLQGEGEIDSDAGLAVSVRGSAWNVWPESLLASLQDTDFDLDLGFEAKDLSLIRSAVPELPIGAGSATGRIRWRGPVSGSRIALALEGHAIEAYSIQPTNLSAEFILEENETSADVSMSNARLGQFFSLSAAADAGWRELLTGKLNALQDSGWRLAFDVRPLLLDRLGLPLGELGDLPVRLSAEAHLDRQAGEPPTGSLRIRAAGPLEQLALAGGQCGGSGPISVAVTVELEEEAPSLWLVWRRGREPVLELDLWSDAEQASWRAWDGNLRDLPQLGLLMSIVRLEVSDLPYLCGHLTGRVNGRIAAEGLLGHSPTLVGSLSGTDMSPAAFSPFSFETDARYENGRLAIHSTARTELGGSLDSLIGVPLDWPGRDVPSRNEEPVEVALHLERFPVAALRDLSPILHRGEGFLDGRLELVFGGDTFTPNGSLRLLDVGLAIPGLDQRIAHVQGDIELDASGLRLRGIRGTDQSGTIWLSGTVGLVDFRPAATRISATLREFPMRHAGTIVARVSGGAVVEVDAGVDALDVVVELSDLAIALPANSAVTLQSLEPHPELNIVGQTAVREQLEAQAEPAREVRIHLDASAPFWVRRHDFSFQLATVLDISQSSAAPRIAGDVAILRGTIDLLGKSFDLQRGSVTFGGGAEVDPTLDLTAVHDLPRHPGETVTATISGRLSQPHLAFSCSLPEATTEVEIVRLLATGRSDSSVLGGQERAADQAASILTGLTAGILTAAGRSEFGEILPVVSVQTGESLGEVGLRAGVVIDRLIPNVLREYIVGVYVEGFLRSELEGEGEESTWGAAAGFLIELYFPLGFLTSAAFQPPSNWSLDLLWQP